MLTLQALRDLGANVDEGMGRCLNNETFYLRLVKKAAEKNGLGDLQAALAAGDLDKAFEAAHGLKGVLGNLSLTPAFQPASELCELLRSKTPGDYNAYLEQVTAWMAKLTELVKS